MPSKDHKFVGLNICCRRHHTRFAYRPSETSWSRNRSSWNQSMQARSARRLKGSQDVAVTTCRGPAEACRPICLGFKPY